MDLSVDTYQVANWVTKWPDYQVDLTQLVVDESWNRILKSETTLEELQHINAFLTKILVKSQGRIDIFPYPDLVFNAFNLISLPKVKVVILGQDPYPRVELGIPQAMGLSFSVPWGLGVPSSLANIYANLVKFGHMKAKPTHGNLTLWAQQGCLMMNTALTVKENAANSHKDEWTRLTDHVIKRISALKKNVVFLLWGGPASSKLSLIDQSKHMVVISSHPSGYSNTSKLGSYSSFSDTDHFGKTNEFLQKHERKPVKWDIILPA